MGERTEDRVVLSIRRVPLLVRGCISVIVNFIFKILRNVLCFPFIVKEVLAFVPDS